jgi:hypothetical protein
VLLALSTLCLKSTVAGGGNYQFRKGIAERTALNPNPCLASYSETA